MVFVGAYSDKKRIGGATAGNRIERMSDGSHRGRWKLMRLEIGVMAACKASQQRHARTAKGQTDKRGVPIPGVW